MEKRFARDYSQILDEENRVREVREKTVSVVSISSEQPLTVLENLIKMWPTHDVRYMGYGTSDDELMKDMVKGAEVRTTRKDITRGILEITVELVKNLDEIERYNAAVVSHNREWKRNGSPTEVFDPVHGDSYKVKDQFIDPVMMQSKHYNLPKSAYSNVSTGKLAQARPNLNRKSHIRVKYQMSISPKNLFTLGYAAYDYDDKIIYYNEVSHSNLAYLVRRSVQEIWGNPTATWEFSDLLNGISMLLNGKKLVICKKDNKIPEFLAHEDTKLKSTKAIRKLEVEEERSIVTSNIAGFNMPVFFIIGFVVCALFSFCNMASEREAVAIWDYLPLLLCILFLFGTIICRKISQDAERKASELSARQKFL